LFGKSLTIIPSKHAAVSLPHPSLQKGSNLARDFSNSPLHRFKYNRSKNFRHICAPGSVLHISNLADEITADELREKFGAKVVAVQFFKTDRRMAFIRMTSISEAVNALVKLHNTKIGGKQIKVTFSPKKPTQVEDDSKTGYGSRQSGSTSEAKTRSQSTSSSSSSTSSSRTSVPAATNQQRSNTSSSNVRSGSGSVPSAVGSTPRSAPSSNKQQSSQQQSSSSSSQRSSVPLSQSAPPQSRIVGSGQQGRGGGSAVRSPSYQQQYGQQDYYGGGGYYGGGYRDKQ